jgi:hypothetical protein
VIEWLRRPLRAVLVIAIVLLLPAVALTLSGATAPQQPTATRGPIQVLCEGAADPNNDAQGPTLAAVVEIHDGTDSAYVLAGPGPQGSTYIHVCRTRGGMSNESSGGLVAPPPDPLLSLDQWGGISSDATDRLYAGRVSPTVARVEATMASGATVNAKVSNGYYLVWSRTLENVVRITALDASGAVVRSIEDANGLMPPH